MHLLCNSTGFYSVDLGGSSGDRTMTLPGTESHLPLDESTVSPNFDSIVNCSEWLNDTYYGNGTLYEDPVYFSYPYRIVGTLFQGIIFLVGVLGNMMVVLVVARTKSMHSPTNCYLVSLALADCIVLIASVPQELISYYLVGNQWIWGDVGCALLIFSQNLGINASSLSLTAFTVERYIAICKPFLAQTVCTVNRAKKIIALVWIFAVFYCLPWLFLTSTYPLYYKGFSDLQSCEFKLSREAYLWYYFADLMVFYVVPLLLSVILYSLIALILYRSHTAKSSSKTNGPLSIDSTRTNAARVQVVKMLVMVVAIFAVLWLPYRGLLVYNSFASWFSKERFMDLWFLMMAKTCIYINCAINPILYNAMSVKFRRAFGRTLSCGKNRDFYDRWPYCRTHTTYTTASTTLPSTSTLTYNMTMVTPTKSPRTNNLSPIPSKIIHHHHPAQKCAYTSVDIVVDAADTIHSCQEDITQL